MHPPLVGAVVLAAGESRRMGAFKPLLPFGAKRVLEAVLDQVRAAGVKHCCVVLGHRAEELRPLVESRGAQPVFNENYSAGMLSSVQCGVAALPGEVDTILIALGDQPEIRADVIRTLLDTFHASSQGLAVPVYQGRRGHPLLIAGKYREEILQLHHEGGLKEWRDRYSEDLLEIPLDTGAVVRDLDYPEDYREALGRLQTGEGGS